MKIDPLSVAASFLDALREREASQDAPAAVQRFGQTYQQLTECARSAERPDQDRMAAALVDGMKTAASNWAFGCIANTCGMIVEWGGDPGLAIEPILDRITEQLKRVPEFVELMQNHLGVEHPNRIAEDDWPKIGAAHPEYAWVIGEWYALRFTGCAAMATLCRDVEGRKRARERIELMQRAEAARSDNPYAFYLAETLALVDDERLLILDTTRQLGFRVQLTAIRNNFHLFTLLQNALTGHSRPVVISVAKSARMLSDISPHEWGPEGEGDRAIWTYYTADALKADGSLRTLNEKDAGQAAWVWGEGKPTAIPPFEKERVVLLGPLEMPRSWSVGFFAPLHPALRSEVAIVDTLNAEACRDWLRKIQGRHGDSVDPAS